MGTSTREAKVPAMAAGAESGKEGVPRPKPDVDVDSAAAQAVPKDQPSTPEEEVDKALEEKFSKVAISTSKVSIAEKALEKVTSDRLESRLFWDKIIGLKADKIQDYADIVIRDLKVAEDSIAVKKIKLAFEKLKLLDEKGGVYS